MFNSTNCLKQTEMGSSVHLKQKHSISGACCTSDPNDKWHKFLSPLYWNVYDYNKWHPVAMVAVCVRERYYWYEA